MSRALSALVLCIALPAAAQDGRGLSLSGSVDLIVQRNDLAVDPATGQPRPDQHQVAPTLLLNWGAWSAGLTGRATNFYRMRSDLTVAEEDYALYRAYLRYTGDGYSAQLGDFNTLLGKGLVLSVVQNDATLQDWTVRGLDFRGRWKGLDVHALGGRVSNKARRLSLYQEWDVLGFESSVEWLRGHRLGVHASRIDDRVVPALLRSVAKGRRDTGSFSVTGTNLGGIFDYTFEAAKVHYRDKREDPFITQTMPWALKETEGSARYGHLVLAKGRWMAMAEYKNYRNFAIELTNPPLADRENERPSFERTEGRRLYLQYTFPEPTLTLFGSAGRVKEGTVLGRAVYEGSHVYGGFKLEDLFDRFSARYSYGLKRAHYNGAYPQKKTTGDLTYQFTPLWSLELTYRDRRNRIPGSRPYLERDEGLQLARSPWGALFLMRQYSSEETFLGPTSTGPRRPMYNGGVRVNFGKGSYVEASGGKLRGGEVCAGGACVTLPPYQGWKLVASLKF